MPQLVPFYFVNEVIFSFTFITIIIYLLSKYILPRIVSLFIYRNIISNFFNKRN
jgi:F-type H+-transporting ATPase subunit 8